MYNFKDIEEFIIENVLAFAYTAVKRRRERQDAYNCDFKTNLAFLIKLIFLVLKTLKKTCECELISVQYSGSANIALFCHFDAYPVFSFGK